MKKDSWPKKHIIWWTVIWFVVGVLFILIFLPQSPPEEKIVTKTETITNEVEVIKYQCNDGTITDSLSLCPKIDETPKGQFQPVTFKGSDNQITDKFWLDKGLVIFKNKYRGESNFIVDLIDENGNNVDLVANTIGDSDTSGLATIRNAGYYRLEVTAWPGSSWEINVEQ